MNPFIEMNLYTNCFNIRHINKLQNIVHKQITCYHCSFMELYADLAQFVYTGMVKTGCSVIKMKIVCYVTDGREACCIETMI